MNKLSHSLPEGIAVVGMSGRYPGANSISEFWDVLAQGEEKISFYSNEELLEAGYDPQLVEDPSFIKARPVYRRPMAFDAAFFGYTPREAEIIDPQQRIFLECAWEALEDAGYDPHEFPGPIGLYGGSGMTYNLFNLIDNRKVMASMGGLAVTTSNEKDYFATRVGYKLNLRGPCVTVQTACSTALVGITFACQSLLTHQTDMALAGGASILPSEMGGYHYTDGGIVSPDGHTRTFDAKGRGTVFGSGAGVIVLKRLSDAIADGDNIHAVIRGYGINNDGSSKVGFTAPAVDGQAAVCLEAMAMAGAHPESIAYIECHGTATPMGDLVEISALSKAFRAYTERRQFCAVGSVKTNIGHMDAAAGVAGLTKAILTLKHRIVPPSLHFETPNPEIDFPNTPFYVNTHNTVLERGDGPLRAGISSFGVGGTNTHIILEEAPELAPTSPGRPYEVIAISARSEKALEKMCLNLARWLEKHPEAVLADVAHTLSVGRRTFAHRAIAVVRSHEEAIAALRGEGVPLLRASKDRDPAATVFLFPGQGSQYAGMAASIYRNEPAFAGVVDACCAVLQPLLGRDLRELLFAQGAEREAANEQLRNTAYTQPALFVVEYALASMWMAWGCEPDAMIGHSIGEYVAACLAGVFELEDALRVVCERGRLMQSMEPGAMLAILAPEAEVSAHALAAGASVAAVNSPGTTVVAGSFAAIEALEARCAELDLPVRRLVTSHAFHSAMMEPMLDAFRDVLATVRLQPPRRRFLSNVTGQWIEKAQATDPEYWVSHLRQPVRYAEDLSAVLQEGPAVLLEVGPGRVLGSLATQHPARTPAHPVLASLPSADSADDDLLWATTTVGRLWLEGRPVRWADYRSEQKRRRISLPTYAFDHDEEYFIENQRRTVADDVASPRKIADVSKWFHYPSWERCSPIRPQLPSSGCALAFVDGGPASAHAVACLQARGWDVIQVRASDQWRAHGPDEYLLRPGCREDYEQLASELQRLGLTPTLAVHAWGMAEGDDSAELERHEQLIDKGFTSLLYLLPQLNAISHGERLPVLVLIDELQDVVGERPRLPTRAAAVGPIRAALAECPNLDVRLVDIDSASATQSGIVAILGEAFAQQSEDPVAYRRGQRWKQSFKPLDTALDDEARFGLRDGGVYLITGGMGGIGLVIAEAIAKRVKARFALLGRSALPPREMWEVVSQGDDLVAEKVRRVMRMEGLGAEVATYGVDVADLAGMKAVVTNVEARWGKIDGVIHSAGVAGGGVMLLKTPEQFNEVLRPKVAGALVLDALFAERPMDFFILCSSLNAFLGEGGISDYIGANAFLDAFAASRSHWATPPLSVQWDSWEDVGMVAKGWFDGVRVDWASRRVEVLDHPLFQSRIVDADGLIYSIELDPQQHWVVGEHVLMGTPTLVGTTNLQWVHSAFVHALGRNAVVEMRDVIFPAPMNVPYGETRKVELAFDRQAEGFGFVVRSRDSQPGAPWAVHAIGKVAEAADAAPSVLDAQAILDRCDALEEQVDTRFEPDEERVPFLQFGDRWINMHAKAFGNGEALGEFRLDERFHGDLDVYGMHPAVMDRATGFAVFKAGAPGAHYLPFAYNRIRVFAGLEGKVYSHVRYEQGDEFVSSNVTLFSMDGRELIQIEGYEVKRVPEDVLEAGTRPRSAVSAPVATDTGMGTRREARIVTADADGVLGRILSIRGLNQVAVACRDLRAVRAEIRGVLGASATQTGPADEQQHLYPRPPLGNPYVEARNDLESALVDIWGAMLGIDKVGIHDDFLELGGNSLLGIQIASRIRTDFDIELSVATFYRSPTVALLAEAILETLQAGLSESELADVLDDIESADA